MQTKTKHTIPIDTASVWAVIPNPDPPNIKTGQTCQCQTYAVKHRDGGYIRFYQGRTMDKQTAIKLAQQLNQQE